MPRHQIPETLVRLGAVLIVVLALHDFADFALYLTGAEPSPVVYGGLVLQLLIPFAIALLLWRSPGLVAVGRSDSEPPPSSHPENLLFVGVSLLGVYALVFGIIDLTYFEAFRFVEREHIQAAYGADVPISPQTVAGRVTNIVQILFGLALIFGRRSIVRLLIRARSVGTRGS